jgi:arylsulfatase A-like enzyme
MGTRPNVILVVLDTVRRDRVFGYDRETMPNLERFGADATTFTDAVTQASWSVPAHASLFTGTYPGTHRATALRPVFRAEPTLPGLLREAGYGTYAVSPNQYVRPGLGFGRGFDRFERPSAHVVPGPLVDAFGPAVNRFTSSAARHPPERLLNAVHARRGTTTRVPAPADDGAVDCVERLLRSASRPFFLFVNLFDAHLPRSPAPEHVDRFVDDSLADAPVVTSERAHKFGPGMDERGFERMGQLYDADLRTLDDRLGVLLETLSRAGVLEESLVVLLSDHGEHLGEFGLVGHQHSVFEGVVSVPLLVRFPDGGPDRVTEQVETRRVFHTILDETGVVAYPEQSLASGRGDVVARGAFYSPMLDIPALLWNDAVRYERRLLGEELSFARTGDHKLVRFDGTDWLFPLPGEERGPLSLPDGRRSYERLADRPATASRR